MTKTSPPRLLPADIRPLSTVHRFLSTVCAAGALALSAHAGAPPASPELMVPATADLAAFKTEKNPVLSLADAGGAKVLQVEFPASDSYPGINLPIPGGSWDLSAYAGIEIEVANTSSIRINLGARVDNPGDWKKSPWNTNNAWLAPGEAKVLKV
ncbi:MAG TPA: hypothetical protein VGD81_11030, partial [Opitutaceae bacterium]